MKMGDFFLTAAFGFLSGMFIGYIFMHDTILTGRTAKSLIEICEQSLPRDQVCIMVAKPVNK